MEVSTTISHRLLRLLVSACLLSTAISFQLSVPRSISSALWSTKSQEHTSHHNQEDDTVVYLGKGTQAIVKIGCVLVAPSYEFNHYYRQSAIFIYGMGTSTRDQSGDYLIRGVILDHCTPFTVGEMMSQDPALANNPLGENLLFRGGDKGGEDVVLLHSHADLGQSSIGEGDDASGIYQGGWDDVLKACSESKIDPQSCKVFFNYVEFTEQELDNMLEDAEDGDAWMSLQVDPSLILEQWPNRGDAWARLRNYVSQSKLNNRLET